MIGIVVALKKEAQKVIDCINQPQKDILCKKEVYTGTLFGKRVVLIISGIGKVNASLSTQFIIDKYSPETVINFGTAGGVDNSVKALNYYIVTESCQFDFDLRDLDGVPLGYIQDYDRAFFPSFSAKIEIDLPKRTLASADRFTESALDTQEIRNIKCSLRDMEGGAISQVCYTNSIPLITIKGVTDVVGNGLTAEQFVYNLQTVSAGFPDVIKRLFDKF